MSFDLSQPPISLGELMGVHLVNAEEVDDVMELPHQVEELSETVADILDGVVYEAFCDDIVEEY